MLEVTLAPERALCDRRTRARQAGYDQGFWYTANLDLGAPGFVPVEWDAVPVPVWYSDVAEHYRSGWDDGRQAYEDGE